MGYADAETQTTWAGLTRSDIVRPEFLRTAPNTTTPPDDMLTQKLQSSGMLNTLATSQRHTATASKGPSLLERRNNAGLVEGFELPVADIVDDEAPHSPPPTNALLSPLPAANKLYAGHTPLLRGSQSPAQDADERVAAERMVEDDQTATPQDDPSLKGPLSLPTNPVDGAAEDHIILHNLDEELEKIAKDQARFSKLKNAPEPSSKSTPDFTEDNVPLSRKASADSRNSNVEYVNGVPLKSPPLNFGAPLGQLKPN